MYTRAYIIIVIYEIRIKTKYINGYANSGHKRLLITRRLSKRADSERKRNKLLDYVCLGHVYPNNKRIKTNVIKCTYRLNK